MVTLMQSNPYLRDKDQTHRRIVENVRQSSAFEGVSGPVRRHDAPPRLMAAKKKTANGS